MTAADRDRHGAPVIAPTPARPRFNHGIGVPGLAVAGGAAPSTHLAGLIANQLGVKTALLALAGRGAMAGLAVPSAPRPGRATSN